jgi:hypothetical protein
MDPWSVKSLNGVVDVQEGQALLIKEVDITLKKRPNWFFRFTRQLQLGRVFGKRNVKTQSRGEAPPRPR